MDDFRWQAEQKKRKKKAEANSIVGGRKCMKIGKWHNISSSSGICVFDGMLWKYRNVIKNLFFG